MKATTEGVIYVDEMNYFFLFIIQYTLYTRGLGATTKYLTPEMWQGHKNVMKSFFIPDGSSTKVQLKVCHRVTEMPPQKSRGGGSLAKGGVWQRWGHTTGERTQ